MSNTSVLSVRDCRAAAADTRRGPVARGRFTPITGAWTRFSLLNQESELRWWSNAVVRWKLSIEDDSPGRSERFGAHSRGCLGDDDDGAESERSQPSRHRRRRGRRFDSVPAPRRKRLPVAGTRIVAQFVDSIDPSSSSSTSRVNRSSSRSGTVGSTSESNLPMRSAFASSSVTWFRSS